MGILRSRRGRRRRGRRLMVLGGLAAGAWTWRNRKLAENERAPAGAPIPGERPYPQPPLDPSAN